MAQPSSRHRRPLAVLAAGTLLIAGTPAMAVSPDPPSAGDVAKSKQVVRSKAKQVGMAKARLVQASGELAGLGDQAALAMERYNGEVVKLNKARAAYLDAQQKLTVAEQNYEQARVELSDFALDSYRSSAGMGGLAALVAGDGGPQGFLDRAGMVQVVTKQRESLMAKVEAAKSVAELLRRQAGKAYELQQHSVTAAEDARQKALGAVAVQKAAVKRIGAEKKRLTAELGRAEARATLLAERRAETLRRKRMAVQAKAAAGDMRASSGTSSLRVSAGRNFRSSGQGSMVVRAALRWIGTPYSWGGGTSSGPSFGIAHGRNTRGFDCSGLALHAWAKAGVDLDHWTGSQWTSGPHVPTSMLRAGDLVFFATNTDDPDTIHHVGIYVGSGQMVEAPYTGARVRISSIWRNGLIGAVRPG